MLSWTLEETAQKYGEPSKLGLFLDSFLKILCMMCEEREGQCVHACVQRPEDNGVESVLSCPL